MKKPNYYSIELLRKKREKKRLKRIGVEYKGTYKHHGPTSEIIEKHLKTCYTKIYHHFKDNNFHKDSLIYQEIQAPEDLSFKDNGSSLNDGG